MSGVRALLKVDTGLKSSSASLPPERARRLEQSVFRIMSVHSTANCAFELREWEQYLARGMFRRISADWRVYNLSLFLLEDMQSRSIKGIVHVATRFSRAIICIWFEIAFGGSASETLSSRCANRDNSPSWAVPHNFELGQEC